MAASPIEQSLVDDIRTYFVEKKEDHSIFRKVEINEYGAITDWPDGFFDQSQAQAEAILRAAAMKRKKQRRSRNA